MADGSNEVFSKGPTPLPLSPNASSRGEGMNLYGGLPPFHSRRTARPAVDRLAWDAPRLAAQNAPNCPVRRTARPAVRTLARPRALLTPCSGLAPRVGRAPKALERTCR